MFDLNLEPGYHNGDGTQCWVCGVDESIHEHHIIPRSAGGINGPTVDLCAVCHNAIHKNVDPDYEGLDTLELSRREIDILNKREWLRDIIITSVARVSNDINRPLTFTDRFPPKTARLLRDLASGLSKSQKEVVRIAIHELHRRYFTEGVVKGGNNGIQKTQESH